MYLGSGGAQPIESGESFARQETRQKKCQSRKQYVQQEKSGGHPPSDATRQDSDWIKKPWTIKESP